MNFFSSKAEREKERGGGDARERERKHNTHSDCECFIYFCQQASVLSRIQYLGALGFVPFAKQHYQDDLIRKKMVAICQPFRAEA